MSSHAEVQNAPPIVSKHQEDIQQMEPDGGHGEEVYRYYALHVILKEGPPSLGRRFSLSNHVFGYRCFGNLNAQLVQLAVNAWCTPARVVAAHHADQIPNLLRHAGPTGLSSVNFSTSKRKPSRCQATTVSALTIISTDFQSPYTRRSRTQNIRSAGVSFSRLGAD
jgi:hypothetical protein